MEDVLNQAKLAQLGEVIRVGLRNSAAVLGEMTGLDLEINTPLIEMVPLKEIAQKAGGVAAVGVGLYLGIAGDIDGHLLLFFPEQNAFALADLLLELPDGTTLAQGHLGEMEHSALSEMSNITGSFFLNSVADVTELEITPSTPAVVLDMLGSILDYILAELSCQGNQALLVEAQFAGMHKGISGYFFLLPTQQALEVILCRLGA